MLGVLAVVKALALARWQFALTAAFHFLFAPLGIGLAFLVAYLQTVAYRRGDPELDAAARFFGKLFLITFGLGVVTGIAIEFQIGMSWSRYATFVGGVFGAPLAVETMLAFAVESTFVGLWAFGRGRLSPRQHLATIWMVSLGTLLSAIFVLAANAWMQHPVGYRMERGQAVLTSLWDVMVNPTALAAYAHVLTASLLTGAVFVLAVAAWHLRRGGSRAVFGRVARVAVVVSLLSVLATIGAGEAQALQMADQQPMKMAAAEGIYDTQRGAGLSLLTIGRLDGSPSFQLRVPHALSLLATGRWNGEVPGIKDLQALEASRYGPGSYKPVLWITYWSFRAMLGLGVALLVLASLGCWLARRGRLEDSRRYLSFATWMVAAPPLANLTGWIFTEMGRQPWVAYGLLKVNDGVSPVGSGYAATSLVAFTLAYGVLATLGLVAMVQVVRRGPEDLTAAGPATAGLAPTGPAPTGPAAEEAGPASAAALPGPGD